MSGRGQHRGFTLIELMIVVSIIGVLASIAIPSLLRMQARARQAEVGTNLKSFYTSMRTLQRKPPVDMHAVGFAPDRGNRYSYHLEDTCTTYEDRSTLVAQMNTPDSCLGADSFRHDGALDWYTPMPPTSATWVGADPSMSVNSGIYGTEDVWDFIGYGAGDVDADPNDGADTWIISSADGEVAPSCPSTGGVTDQIVAGEPYNTHNDVNCD
ncbi:MAG TPA: prepilin-type N-terminal cleavage/methylation domain-containing protein [Hyalangium sp.]|nr:prepilin-type N-terminal cleavage/methylation domain-containing protein [Hyalangium sp.]